MGINLITINEKFHEINQKAVERNERFIERSNKRKMSEDQEFKKYLLKNNKIINFILLLDFQELNKHRFFHL